MLGLVGLGARLKVVNGGHIGAQRLVHLFAAGCEEEQDREPDIGDQNIDRNPDREHFRPDVEDFANGGLVGSAADPAARHGRHAAPDFLGARTAEQVWIDRAGQQECERSANNDPQRSGKEHNQGLGPEPQGCRQVSRDHQQYESGRQEIARSDVVQL